ncbi:unnamed protein product [Pleuronectes platessa]|uniref:Uncharacterized protein n=1 Tax=Pleuronectes platessa TaxID=8262 RepID=A0A9N7ZC87_PLEPL|nr:unnamed protein product [Pleuronectes platessa]
MGVERQVVMRETDAKRGERGGGKRGMRGKFLHRRGYESSSPASTHLLSFTRERESEREVGGPASVSDGLIKAARNERGEEEAEERGGQEGDTEKKGVMIRGMSLSYQSRSLFKHSTPFLFLPDAAAAPGFSHSAVFAMK